MTDMTPGPLSPEEIASTLDAVCEHWGWDLPDDVLDAMADALLARLRPEWEFLATGLYEADRTEEKLRATVDALRADYERACQTIARIHAAAIGEIAGPRRGIVEDVEDLRADLRAVAEALAREAKCLRCRGEGTVYRPCSDPQHGDSTWDHGCDDSDVPCPECKGAKITLLAREVLARPGVRAVREEQG